ncbi:MAG: DNA polymerase, partial [Pseudonocardiaceae bacterium]
VGEKTAARLVNTYGSLDAIFENLESAAPKLRESLRAAEPLVRLNAQATPLIRNVPLAVQVDDLTLGEFDVAAVRDLFMFLEFRSLFDRLVAAMGVPTFEGEAPSTTPAERLEIQVIVVATAAQAVTVLANGDSTSSWAAAWAANELGGSLLGIAVAGKDRTAPGWISADLLEHCDIVAAIKSASFHAHDAKRLVRATGTQGLRIDTSVAAYLLDPGEAHYHLADLALRFADLDITAPEAPPTGQLDLSGTTIDPAEQAGRQAAAVAHIAPRMAEALDQRGLRRLYDDIERPLVRVLARMEQVGIRVDVDRLRGLYNDVVAESQRLEAEICQLAGEVFLINSTPQLRRILFDKLGLAPQKKTKTGFSTDAASLARLASQHPIIEPLLRYREVEKLRSTYGESLLGEIATDGRIHATFNQTVARTGRLSSDRPNLHNIPVRTDEGRRIRSTFIPTEGCRFLVADYNQIELRVIAHLAQDPGLIAAFEAGTDIHSETAARI